MSPLPRWPLLRAMQDTQHSHLILGIKDFVNSDIWERWKSNLPCAYDAPRAPDTWKGLQLADALDHGLGYPSRGLRTAFCNVVADPFQIVRGVRGPADAHQPRYRRSMRAATSSCSISLPSRAEARPRSTSVRNHSSWSIELDNRSSATWSTERPVSVANRVNFASSSGGTWRFMKPA